MTFSFFWLMIVSSAMAVLPVLRSPMISSRWPRPMGVMASMALMPVCKGVSTGCRPATPGAVNSTGRRCPETISPLPSRGLPSGSMTRPIRASPTGTDRSCPVARTSCPSAISRYSPRMMTPTEFSSRLKATPRTLASVNSTISPAMTPDSPYTRAMPSPTSSTRPTSSTAPVFRPYWLISLTRTDTTSFGFNDMTASLDQLVAEGVQLPEDAGVEAPVAELHDQPAQQVRLDADVEDRFLVGDLAGPLQEPVALIVRQRGGRADGHPHPAGLLLDHFVVQNRRGPEHLQPLVVVEDQEVVQEERVDPALQGLRQDLLVGLTAGDAAGEERADHGVGRGNFREQRRQLLADLLDGIVLPRHGVEGLGVDAGHALRPDIDPRMSGVRCRAHV